LGLRDHGGLIKVRGSARSLIENGVENLS
jgi:hypothetical protein